MASAHHPWLPNSPPKTRVLESTPWVRQHISFETLPAEIRNHIYELSMPCQADGDQLVVATPLWNGSITIGRQPAITRANRQTRQESLEMFYANNAFYAWIDRFNFEPLIRWVKCVTSGPSPPKIKVHVMLMHKMSCYVELEKLAVAWRTLKHETIYLRVKTAYSYQPPMYDRRQCVAVADAIKTAEKSKAAGWMNGKVMSRDVRWVWQYLCETRCKIPAYLEFHQAELCSVEAALNY